MPTCDRLTDQSKRIQDMALREALQLGHNYIGPEHLLLAIVRHGDNAGAEALDFLMNLSAEQGKPPPIGLLGALRVRILDIGRQNLGSPGDAVRDAYKAEQKRREKAEESAKKDEEPKKPPPADNPLGGLLDGLGTGAALLTGLDQFRHAAVDFLEKMADDLKPR